MEKSRLKGDAQGPNASLMTKKKTITFMFVLKTKKNFFKLGSRPPTPPPPKKNYVGG